MTSALSPALGVPTLSPIRVLLAEDEGHLGMILEQYLKARGFDVTIVRNGRAALEALRAESFDVALLDIVMPELDGLEVLRLVREEPLPPEIIVITGNGTIETAIAALKLGAYDFLSKPYRMAEIDALVRRAWEKRMLARDNHMLHARLRRATGRPRFVTQYAPLVAVMSMVERVAPGGAPMLITGEPGTGKGLVARVLHEHGGHADGPFIDLDCGALAAPLHERELFGVERGALPGVGERSIGRLEQATGGTLCLEHVDCLDPVAQERLLHALETGRFSRVGGVQQLPMGTRVVASTTRDLSGLVGAGRFRDDLLHRISVIRVALPPLRERVTDIALLARYFVDEFGGAHPPRLTSDAVSALERYDWPGNVRELRNVIERGVLLAVDGTISAGAVPRASASSDGPGPGGDADAGGRMTTPTTLLTLEALERHHIADALERVQWHQGRASELLGISPKTLYRKIREFGFKRPSGPR